MHKCLILHLATINSTYNIIVSDNHLEQYVLQCENVKKKKKKKKKMNHSTEDSILHKCMSSYYLKIASAIYGKGNLIFSLLKCNHVFTCMLSTEDSKLSLCYQLLIANYCHAIYWRQQIIWYLLRIANYIFMVSTKDGKLCSNLWSI